MKTIMTTSALFLATTLTVSAAMSFNLNEISTEYNGALAEENSPREQQPSKAQKPVIKKSAKKLNEVQQVTAPDVELKATFDMMTQEIVRVQAVYDSGQYGQALNESKKLLDTVRIRTGIHPKAKITEKIEIKNVFELANEATTFNQLNQNEKEIITLAVLNHRGGLYLDILNQTKRASLLYTKSLYKRLKQDGTLLKDDVEKIKTDLLSIMAIKIDLVQYDVGARLSIKDSDVANSDQNYLFNREIKVFALNTKELGLTEDSLDQLLNPVAIKPIIQHYDIEICGKLIKDKYVSYNGTYSYPWSHEMFSAESLISFCNTYTKSEIDCANRVYNSDDPRFFINNTIKMCAKK